MEEIEGLDYLSPNERERYIQEQRQSARIERIKASRQQFGNFYKNRLNRFSEQKKAHEEKKKKKSEEEKQMKKRQIENFRSRLAVAQKNMGTAQSNAADAMLEEQQYKAQQKIERKEQQRIAQARFAEAMGVVRANDPRIPLQERANKIVSARDVANKREAAAIEKFNKMMKEQKEQEKLAQEALKAQEEVFLHPKLNPEDFANTHFHAGIGIIPVTHDAVNYQKELEKSEQAEKEQMQKRKNDIIKRTKRAAFQHQIEKDTENLAKELQAIHQTEVDEQLDAIKKHPQRELIAGTTYNLVDRDAKKQARIQRFLAFNDDAPKPRGPAPQPQPLHMIPTSPVQSDDEIDEDDFLYK
ncbi:hypothetical protein TRFO_03849 [Tritrichomonas foetus]|uniref:Uncharacterized protein n=1 Tax=Tritrichomonas foetus TaxID=1144522 RepID=A0A1J4KPL1_9EUKA|nr:hypothetical protein TRFO_03849 [Tritrichomonas foetus]|eukprot:OHT11646.1 hypothetical protein TRFO_03849 [Tritrichomonas foetus]